MNTIHGYYKSRGNTRSARLFWAGLATLNVGTAPLAIYVLLAPKGSLSLGSGLLMVLWLSWIVGAVLLVGAGVSYMRTHPGGRSLHGETALEGSKEPG